MVNEILGPILEGADGFRALALGKLWQSVLCSWELYKGLRSLGEAVFGRSRPVGGITKDLANFVWEKCDIMGGKISSLKCVFQEVHSTSL